MWRSKLLLLFLVPFLGSCELVDKILYNFHTVEEGRLYRVNQLKTTEDWLDHFEKYNIKTLVNLRGEQEPGKTDWWEAEVAAVEQAGVEHVNIRMSAKSLPHAENLRKLLDTFREAEYPILIHCQGGADRTGEASALYEMLYMGSSLDEALDQLTLKYHHIKQRYPAKRYFVKDVWQGEQWAYEEYDPCSGDYQYYNVDNPHCTGGQ